MNENNKNIKKYFFYQSHKTCLDFYQSKNFRTFSHNIRIINMKNKKFLTYIKGNSINSISSKKFVSTFHKSLMHGKLSSNSKYIDIENRICNTDRENKSKNFIENYKDQHTPNLENKNVKFFLTSYNNSYNTEANLKINRPFNSFNIYQNTENNKINKFDDNIINIHSNVFLPLDLKKLRQNFYPGIISPKISDLIEDLKILRTSKFINSLKKELYQQKGAFVGFEKETFDITIHSLKKSIKLLNCYNLSFMNYNKFLIEKIEKEKKVLKNYILDENKIKDNVFFLQKKFDDLMLQLEILYNLKILFEAIKNKKKIKNNDLLNKSFVEKTKERLKQKIKFNKKNSINLSKKKALMKKKSLYSKNNHENEKIEIKKYLKKKETIGKLEENSSRENWKHQTILNIKSNEFIKKRKMIRLNSLQPSMNSLKNNIDVNNIKSLNLNAIHFDEYDIEKEFNKIRNNILNLMEKFNDIRYYVVNSKLLFYKESNSYIKLMIENKIKEKINELNNCKKYNKSLIHKLNFVRSQNEDYSILLFIYHKFNEIIFAIRGNKIKKFQLLIDQLTNIYDRNKIYILYSKEKNLNSSMKAYLEIDLYNYLYRVFLLFEKLIYVLIQGKNDALKNNFYSEKIEEFENNKDNAKKLINKLKKNEEIIRREKIKENTIKKINKMLYLPRRKVASNFQFINFKTKKTSREKGKKQNIYANLLFY